MTKKQFLRLAKSIGCDPTKAKQWHHNWRAYMKGWLNADKGMKK